MKKIVFNNLDEVIYKETFSNGVNAYLYPTDKTKNFYITISVKYGGKVKEYRVNGQKKEIIPGTAHFLEHKVMNFTNRKKESDIINRLGLYANAYTSFDITNYNIFGSKDIISSLKLLLDLFYNLNINEQNVNSEKGIISEEYKMYNDNPNFRINKEVVNNVFKNSYLKDVLVGNIKQINKISVNDLKRVYNDFYTTDNTFIIVTGNFDLNKVIDFLKDYMKNIKSNSKNIKIVNKNEQEEVVNNYVEIEESITIPRVIYSLKIRKSNIHITNKILKRYYLNFIFSSLFSNTSSIYEKYKDKSLAYSMSYDITDAGKYYLMNLKIITDKPNDLIKCLKKDLKDPYIDERTFLRKKKMFINNLILGFENIEDVEDMITNHIIRVNHIINNSSNLLKSMKYKEMQRVLKEINFNNYSILKVNIKK